MDMNPAFLASGFACALASALRNLQLYESWQWVSVMGDHRKSRLIPQERGSPGSHGNFAISLAKPFAGMLEVGYPLRSGLGAPYDARRAPAGRAATA